MVSIRACPRRWDRLAFIVTTLLFAAATMNLATYACKQVSAEDMYAGPARIVGYQTAQDDTLQAGQRGTRTRTDLEVAWGGVWACPHVDDSRKECRAPVNGAVCEMDDNKQLWDDDNGGTVEKDKTTGEVYYDEAGNKVTKKTDQDVEYDVKGQVMDMYQANQTTHYNKKGAVKKYEEESEDTEFNGNGSVEEVTEESQSGTYSNGHIQQGEYEYQDERYNDKGALVEHYGEAEAMARTGGGGTDDVDVSVDITYTDKGQVDEEEYSVSEREKDAAGKNTDAAFEDVYVKEGGTGTVQEEIIDEGEINFDEDGHVQEERVEDEEAHQNSQGQMGYETLQEEINYTEDGGYNVTSEVIEYDEDGNVVEDEIGHWDSGGGRNRRVLAVVSDLRQLQDDGSSTGSSGGADKGLTMQQELQEQEEENEKLKKQNEELEKKNEELQEGINKGETEKTASNNDGDYWEETDWGSVWGDYQCYNLFDADLEGVAYDPHTAAGSDEWPYLNIYGNCRTCQAYVVDYYSTEHFQAVQSYRTAGRNYGIASAVGLLLTAVLAVRRRRLSAKGDREIDLLPSATAKFS